MNPLWDFAHMAVKCGPEPRFWPRAALYVLKLGAFEPFRWAEALSERSAPVPPTLPRAPVFILGYYRSGTTHLQEVLLQDPRFGYMNFYQGFFPTAFSSTERFVKPVFEAIITRTRFRHPAHGVPFSFHLPAEEDVALVAAASRLAANWGQVYPQKFRAIYGPTGLLDGLHPADERALQRQLHALIWRVSKANGHKRLLLKSPPHTGRLRLLRAMYPEARFIFLRRDPFAVFESNLGLWRSFEDQHLQRVSPSEVREHILWSYDRAHENYARDKEALPAHALVELAFEDFLADPLGQLEQVYERLELGAFPALRDRFVRYLDARHDPVVRPAQLSEPDRALVAERWAPWIAAWGYAEPTGARCAAR